MFFKTKSIGCFIIIKGTMVSLQNSTSSAGMRAIWSTRRGVCIWIYL